MLMCSACEDDPADPLATARMEIVSGQQQVGDAGAALGDPVSVRIVTGDGTPLRNVQVEWTVLEGGGAVDPATSATDANGMAVTSWTLGEEPGVQALLARAPTASARIEASAIIYFNQITAGFRHSCALTTGGRAYCWGANDRGQLGIGVLSAREGPTLVADSTRFTAIAAGWSHTCALTEFGTAYCWGDNTVGQAAASAGIVATPQRVAITESIQWLSAGYQHTCATTVSGAAWCWGVDDVGALGSGGTTPTCYSGLVQRCTRTPQRVATPLVLTRVVAGEFHSCAAGIDGAGYCWGWNSNGQIGNLAAGNAIVGVPARVVSNRFYAFFGAGSRHNCAITTGERLECWGRNAAGEIGVIAGTALGAPEPLTSPLQARQIDAGETHSCALGTDQRVYCWGSLLGNGTTAASSTPVQVSVSGAATSIGAGGDHACAIVDGHPWCWGSNSHGQLGVATVPRSSAPVRVQVGR